MPGMQNVKAAVCEPNAQSTLSPLPDEIFQGLLNVAAAHALSLFCLYRTFHLARRDCRRARFSHSDARGNQRKLGRACQRNSR